MKPSPALGTTTQPLQPWASSQSSKSSALPFERPNTRPPPSTLPPERDFPASQADFAVRVAYCESGFNPNAVGDQGRARGIFQFWRGTFLGTDVGATYGWDAAFDAEINVRAAAELVARGGWGPWTCARKV